MASDVITTIGQTSSPTTPDYSTLQAWEDDIPANLVTADQRHIGECLDQGTFTAGLVIGGHTVDATRYVILRCASGASFADKGGVRTTALTYNTANGVTVETSGIAIEISNDYTQVRGLQVKRTGYSGVSGYRTSTPLSNVTTDDCIINCQAELKTSTIRNSLIMGTVTNLVSGQPNVYGCTVINTGGSGTTAITSDYSSATVKNTAVFNFTTFSGSPTKAGSDYNATDLSSASTGSNNLTSLTFSSEVENTTNDFRAKSTGNLQAGTPDATNTPDDITGLTRDATTPWIGCWEISGGGAGVESYGLSAIGVGDPHLSGVVSQGLHTIETGVIA